MKYYFWLTNIVILLIAVSASAQKGTPFPVLEGKTLNGDNISFPLKTDKNTIVCLVYSPKTEKAFDSWVQPLANTFLVKNHPF